MAHLHLILQGLVEEQRLFDAREAEKLGISHQLLQYYCVTGKLKRLSSGVYAPAEWEETPAAQTEILQRKCSTFVLCLDSALYFHGLAAERPPEVWIAIRQGDRRPVVNVPTQCVRIIPEIFTYGIETHTVNGRPLQVYSPARTAIDFFRYRHKLGEGRAIRNLMTVYRQRSASLEELTAASQACHASKAIAPYLAMLRQS